MSTDIHKSDFADYSAGCFLTANFDSSCMKINISREDSNKYLQDSHTLFSFEVTPYDGAKFH